MVRTYDVGRPVPAEVIDRIVGNGLRAPSAGFSQGWAFLVPGSGTRSARPIIPRSGLPPAWMPRC
jgi:hypothetical protein